MAGVLKRAKDLLGTTGRAQAAGSEAAATAVARGEHRPGFAALRGRRGPGPQAVPVARGAVLAAQGLRPGGSAPAITNTTTTAEKAHAARSELGVSVDGYYGLEKVDKRGGPKRGRRKTDR